MLQKRSNWQEYSDKIELTGADVVFHGLWSSGVIFSDEVRFCLRSDGIVKVWRLQHRRFDPRYTVKKSKDRRSMMFWGYIRHDGYRLLLRCPEPFTSSDYLIFLEIAKTAMIGGNFIFQDDNCPVHRSHAV